MAISATHKAKGWADVLPPIHLDRVWRHLILYSTKYAEYCQSIWGEYMHRIDPSIDYNKSGSKETELINTLFIDLSSTIID